MVREGGLRRGREHIFGGGRRFLGEGRRLGGGRFLAERVRSQGEGRLVCSLLEKHCMLPYFQLCVYII